MKIDTSILKHLFPVVAVLLIWDRKRGGRGSDDVEFLEHDKKCEFIGNHPFGMLSTEYNEKIYDAESSETRDHVPTDLFRVLTGWSQTGRVGICDDYTGNLTVTVD